MILQDPVPHIIARPSPNDILEWRKLYFNIIYVIKEAVLYSVIMIKLVQITAHFCTTSLSVNRAIGGIDVGISKQL